MMQGGQRRRRAAAEALLDALVTRSIEGYAASVAALSQALRTFRPRRRASRERAG
jgi:hypothetical protein